MEIINKMTQKLVRETEDVKEFGFMFGMSICLIRMIFDMNCLSCILSDFLIFVCFTLILISSYLETDRGEIRKRT